MATAPLIYGPQGTMDKSPHSASAFARLEAHQQHVPVAGGRRYGH
ncbi:hypothetical protein BN2537_497 [Streptomyces venezuelae]|nr:hypothetical protein BN2537_497 [Streptomyces venezuelae]